MSTTRPNILLITSDQHRADHLGCMGHPAVATPHLDLLARRGIVFENALVDCPVCIPARTTLLTGIQSHRYGSPDFNPEFRLHRDRADMLGGLLGASGYQTEVIGKTHWHLDKTHRGGFDHVTTFEALKRERDRRLGTGWRHGLGWNELSPMLSHLPPELNSTHYVVDRCLEFLGERDRQQPFFLWASFIEPHPPTSIHEPFFSMYRDVPWPSPLFPEWSTGPRCPWAIRKLRSGNSHNWLPSRQQERGRQVYAGMVTHLDYQIGRLLGAIDWSNTMVVYTSDHGEFLGDLGTFFKGSVIAGAARVPLIVHLPPSFGGSRVSRRPELVALEDWLPTFCELAGATSPGDIDGRSLVPLISGSQGTPWREEWHSQIGQQHAFYCGDLKYCYFADDGAELVFRWREDFHDQHDLSADRGLVEPLRLRFREHLRRENHPHLSGDSLLNLGRREEDIDPADALGWMGLEGN